MTRAQSFLRFSYRPTRAMRRRSSRAPRPRSIAFSMTRIILGGFVVWLAYGVHGNESSSAEAAMLVASTLLRDPEAAKILDDVVVIIDPLDTFARAQAWGPSQGLRSTLAGSDGRA